jgi:hypothetical protein
MAPRRHKPAATAADPAGNDSGAGADGVSYGLDENAYGQDGATGNDNENGDYADGDRDGVVAGARESDNRDGEDAAGEYDEDGTDAEYDEDGEYDDEDGTDAESEDDDYDAGADPDDDDDDDDESFRPPTALSAIRNTFRDRQRAQPATGTEEDAQRINFINKRERMIGVVFCGLMVGLSIVLYFHYLHVVDVKDVKLQDEYHRDAPWVLLITLGLAVMIGLATLSKRRAAVAFTILLAGVANFSVIPEIGIIYLGVGLWLIFRSMRRNPRSVAAAAARAGTTPRGRSTSARGTSASTRASTRAGASSANTGKTSSTDSGPSSSRPSIRNSTSGTSGRTIGKNGRIAGAPAPGRYTPPKPARHVPPAVQPEPEPSNRLSSWLKK